VLGSVTTTLLSATSSSSTDARESLILAILRTTTAEVASIAESCQRSAVSCSSPRGTFLAMAPIGSQLPAWLRGYSVLCVTTH
jgi:hypothetical protein